MTAKMFCMVHPCFGVRKLTAGNLQNGWLVVHDCSFCKVVAIEVTTSLFSGACRCDSCFGNCPPPPPPVDTSKNTN